MKSTVTRNGHMPCKIAMPGAMMEMSKDTRRLRGWTLRLTIIQGEILHSGWHVQYLIRDLPRESG